MRSANAERELSEGPTESFLASLLSPPPFNVVVRTPRVMHCYGTDDHGYTESRQSGLGKSMVRIGSSPNPCYLKDLSPGVPYPSYLLAYIFFLLLFLRSDCLKDLVARAQSQTVRVTGSSDVASV